MRGGLGQGEVLALAQPGGVGAVEDPLHGRAERREEGLVEHFAVVDDVHVEDGRGLDLQQPRRVVERAVGEQVVGLTLRYGEHDRVRAERLARNLNAPGPVFVRREGGDA